MRRRGVGTLLIFLIMACINFSDSSCLITTPLTCDSFDLVTRSNEFHLVLASARNVIKTSSGWETVVSHPLFHFFLHSIYAEFKACAGIAGVLLDG